MEWQCEYCGERYQERPSPCVHCGQETLAPSRFAAEPTPGEESAGYRLGLVVALLVVSVLAGLFNLGVVQF